MPRSWQVQYGSRREVTTTQSGSLVATITEEEVRRHFPHLLPTDPISVTMVQELAECYDYAIEMIDGMVWQITPGTRPVIHNLDEEATVSVTALGVAAPRPDAAWEANRASHRAVYAHEANCACPLCTFKIEVPKVDASEPVGECGTDF